MLNTKFQSFLNINLYSQIEFPSPKLFSLRDPAKANWRQGRLEAGRLRYEDEDKAGEAKRQILYVLEALWDPFWCPNPSKIDPKSSWNHQKSNSGSLVGPAPGVRRRCSMSALGVLGGNPVLVLGWFWAPESIQN